MDIQQFKDEMQARKWNQARKTQKMWDTIIIIGIAVSVVISVILIK